MFCLLICCHGDRSSLVWPLGRGNRDMRYSAWRKEICRHRSIETELLWEALFFNRPDNRSCLHRNRMTRADLPIQFNIMFPPPSLSSWCNDMVNRGLTTYKATKKEQFGEGTKRGILGSHCCSIAQLHFLFHLFSSPTSFSGDLILKPHSSKQTTKAMS